MDDREIRALLERFRPAEPPADLRFSIRQLTNSIRQPTDSPVRQLTWPWAVAAATLLGAAIALHVTPAPGDNPRTRAMHEQRIATMTAALGGSGTGRLLAQTLVADEERTLAEADSQRRPSELTSQ